ncbi:hypothetical protein J132_04553 [Termitomyces sp. J132]|nr:hypothetical protein J132_04553 [Termitomyces sp. J132]
MTLRRHPLDTISLHVLIYPADGKEPYITRMEFNQAGAKHPFGLYTTAVDLRSTYGKSLKQGIRRQLLTVENQPDKELEGDYCIYFNIDWKLPLNLAMARIAGINPKHPGTRPTWRGDVVVVKEKEWPEPVIWTEVGANHMDWINVRKGAKELIDRFIPRWYKSKDWERLVDFERDSERLLRNSEWCFNTFKLKLRLRNVWTLDIVSDPRASLIEATLGSRPTPEFFGE